MRLPELYENIVGFFWGGHWGQPLFCLDKDGTIFLILLVCQGLLCSCK